MGGKGWYGTGRGGGRAGTGGWGMGQGGPGTEWGTKLAETGQLGERRDG